MLIILYAEEEALAYYFRPLLKQLLLLRIEKERFKSLTQNYGPVEESLIDEAQDCLNRIEACKAKIPLAFRELMVQRMYKTTIEKLRSQVEETLAAITAKKKTLHPEVMSMLDLATLETRLGSAILANIRDKLSFGTAVLKKATLNDRL